MAGFKQMQKQMGISKFNKYCATIASDYGRSETQYAGTHFSETYGISKDCFYKVLDYAVVHYLVTDWVVNLMEAKAQRNTESHGSTGLSSLKHYQELREKRRQFVYDLSRDFVKNEDKPLSYFLEKYGREAKGFRAILEKGLDGAEYYGITPEMASTIQYRIFFEIVPALSDE